MSIFQIIKLLPLAGDVRRAIRESSGYDVWYVSRKLIGPVVALIAGYIAIRYGVQIDQNILDSVTQNGETLVSSIAVLWGAIATIRSLLKR